MSTINSRVRELRKSLKLNQRTFGAKLGLKNNSLSQIESGVNNVTERLIMALCREFGANESWLRTGEGTMFVPVTMSEEISNFAANILKDKDNEFRKKFVHMLSKLNTTEWDLLEHMMLDLCNTEEESND
jgi:transcriptional regulator with XRE-family HTH domain